MDGSDGSFGSKNASNLVSTGIAELDTILGGGLPSKHIYLIQGQPGVGKTTLALQFLITGRDAGESVLYVTLSESSDDLKLSAKGHGWSLDGIEIYEHWSTAAANSEAYHTLFHPDEVDLSETIHDLLDVVDRHKPSRIVFDSLSELRLLASDDLRYRRQIIALRDKFAAENCTVLLLDDKSVSNNDLQIQSVAHGVLQLQESAPDYGPVRRRLRIAKLRGVDYSSGFHDYKIETGGIRVFPRLVAAEHRNEFVPGKVSGNIPELDQMFRGGLDRGTTSLLIGPSGTGKSTIAMQFATTAASHGEKVAVYCFDERLSTLLDRTKRLGMDLEGAISRDEIVVTPIDPAELSPGEFAITVKAAVEDQGASIVVIDSLSGYFHAMPDARFLMLQLHELLTFLGQKGVTTIIAVTQHGLLASDASSDLDVSYLSDSILLFRYFEQGGEVRVAVSIFKRRAGQHERTIRQLSMSEEHGITLSAPLSDFQGILTGVALYDRSRNDHVLYEQ
jgi:circadian clock protein KaiC